MHHIPGPPAAIPAMAISVLAASISVFISVPILVSVLVFHTSVSKTLSVKPKSVSLKSVQDYIKIKSCNKLMERMNCQITFLQI